MVVGSSRLLLALVMAMAGSCLVAWGDLVITEVMSSSANPGGNANGDWWELYNSGDSTVDLSLYSWDDDSQIPGTAAFTNENHPTLLLEADQALVVCRETVGDEELWRDAWGIASLVKVVNLGSGVPALSGVDGVYVYDAANALVTSVSWTLQATGTSRWWSVNGVDMGYSIEGQYGAFKAATDGNGGPGLDIGSPGFVYVPEPTSLTLFVFSILCCFIIRRKVK